MLKQNQVIAIESGVKNRANAYLSEVYKLVQHPNLFEGFNKRYQALDEDGEKFNPESKKVQMTAQQVIDGVRSHLGELFDVTATKDFGNCEARADVVVDGTALLTKVPVTYLLFLEKQLTDLHTLVGKLPTLDPAQDWQLDANAGLFRTQPTLGAKGKKVQKALVLYPATEKHPAQTQLITEDVTIGHWETTMLSGAIQAPAKAALVGRIEKLQKAVKFAREEANTTAVNEQKIGEKVLGWLFG